ncbi:hypothetical protein BDN70DRAFT_923003 [Pholiota conissans]|uniref:Uncharacterized protein n=1 Tax=Pholiota conissans TaxID=109636 RepID=A0A9P6CS22_9AGAR|nr:hypothetical protein BDN70DRAFT_923003 [Pholiota conissans]
MGKRDRAELGKGAATWEQFGLIGARTSTAENMGKESTQMRLKNRICEAGPTYSLHLPPSILEREDVSSSLKQYLERTDVVVNKRKLFEFDPSFHGRGPDVRGHTSRKVKSKDFGARIGDRSGNRGNSGMVLTLFQPVQLQPSISVILTCRDSDDDVADYHVPLITVKSLRSRICDNDGPKEERAMGERRDKAKLRKRRILRRESSTGQWMNTECIDQEQRIRESRVLIMARCRG